MAIFNQLLKQFRIQPNHKCMEKKTFMVCWWAICNESVYSKDMVELLTPNAHV